MQLTCVWFMACIIREIKAKQEGVAKSISLYANIPVDGRSGYALSRSVYEAGMRSLDAPEGNNPHINGWQLEASNVALTLLLWGSNQTYCNKLQKARKERSVDLGIFREAMREFLESWTSECLLLLYGTSVIDTPRRIEPNRES